MLVRVSADGDGRKLFSSTDEAGSGGKSVVKTQFTIFNDGVRLSTGSKAIYGCGGMESDSGQILDYFWADLAESRSLAASQSEEDRLVIAIGNQSGRSLIPSADLDPIRVFEKTAKLTIIGRWCRGGVSFRGRRSREEEEEEGGVTRGGRAERRE